MRRFAVTSTALAILACAGCADGNRTDTAASSTTPTALGGVRRLADTPFERSWDLPVPSPVHASFISEQLPDALFVQLDNTKHQIACIDAFSGHTRWLSAPLPEALRLPPSVVRNRLPGERQGTFTVEDRLYVTMQGTLWCLDVVTGQLIWRYPLPFSPSTGPVAVGNDANVRVFLGDWRGGVQVVSVDTARSLPYIAWQWNLGSAVTATPVAAEDLVYVNDQDGNVSAFRLDRARAWTVNLGSPITAPATVRDRVLFVADQDHVLNALDRFTGETLGRIHVEAPISRAPLAFKADPGRVYIWQDGIGLTAVQAQFDSVPFAVGKRPPQEVVRFATAWTLAGVDTLVGTTPAHLFLTGKARPGEVLTVDRKTGQILWRIDVAQERRSGGMASVPITHVTTYSDPLDVNRSIYAADANGHLTAYRFLGYVPGGNDSLSATAAATSAPPANP